MAHAAALHQRLADRNIRVTMDDREDFSPGWKFNEYEMRGIPVRLEIGPRDMEKGQVVLVRRDTGEKLFVPEGELTERLPRLLEEIQHNMFDKAKKFRDDHSHVVHAWKN